MFSLASRWDELHPLVQTAVREAERREADARTAERDRVSPERLAPEAVRAMAGQVLHKVVADYALTYIEPDHLNGTAQAIGKVLVLNGSDCPETGHVRDTERAFRDIRMMKVKMKVSGGFRTWAGAETFATLRSVLSTARKQGRNSLHTLIAPAATLIQDLSG